jgi:DNA-binding transcriptional MerR regulator
LRAFRIGEVADRTGIPEGTLRMWERRHGFPEPERLPKGHRRYSKRDIELVRRVASERAAGASLPLAIERALRDIESPPAPLYGMLRRRHPDIVPHTLHKHAMLRLSRAIEDECLARADRALLFASFQRASFFRREEARWRAFARGAELTIAFADFEQLRLPRAAPAELPIGADHPLAHEWAIVCDAPQHAACLVGWERTTGVAAPAGARWFEVIWSVDPEVVRDAARIYADIAAGIRAELVEPVRARLDAVAAQPARAQLRLAAAITNRMLASVGATDGAPRTMGG